MPKTYQYRSLSNQHSYSTECKLWSMAIVLCAIGLLIYYIGIHNVPINTINMQPYQQLQYQRIQPGLCQQWPIPEKEKQQTQDQRKKRQILENKERIRQRKNDPTKGTSAQIRIQQLQWAKIQYRALMNDEKIEQLDREYKQYMEYKYRVQQHKQMPICVVVPTFNNVEDERYKKNIQSILAQQYQNYRVIVIDDKSQDKTGQVLKQYLQSNNKLTNNITIKVNQERTMALPNILYAAYNFCKPYQLFMVIDGDDYLLGKQVFKLFNSAFTQTQCWVAYSNFLTLNDKVGYSRPYPQVVIEKASFRDVMFVISHLRVFYTKLLYLVEDSDLRDLKGNYFRAANDVAIYMPILQMCGHRIQYIRQINYLYNSKTLYNNHKEKAKEQRENDRYVRGKRKYEQLSELLSFDEVIYLQEKIL